MSIAEDPECRGRLENKETSGHVFINCTAICQACMNFLVVTQTHKHLLH